MTTRVVQAIVNLVKPNTRAIDGLARKRQLDLKLISAAGNGDVKTVKKLLGKGADVNAADQYGDTALIKAARSGCIEVVKRLLSVKKWGQQWVHVNATNTFGETALSLATVAGDTEIIEALKSAGATE